MTLQAQRSVAVIIIGEAYLKTTLQFVFLRKVNMILSCHVYGEQTCTARLLLDYSEQLCVSKSSDSAIRYGRVRGSDPEPCSAAGPEHWLFGSYRIYRSWRCT